MAGDLVETGSFAPGGRSGKELARQKSNHLAKHMKINLAINGIASFIVGLFSLGMYSGISPDDDPGNSSMVEVDYRYLISRADLIYHEPVSRSEEGMPVGNGRMGSLIWTAPDALKLQVNRVDVFANNTASNNFYERHSDYCGGTGFIDIDFIDYGREVFTPGNFFQHLSCYDGLITTRGDGVEVTTFAWNEQDVIVLQVKDERDDPAPVNINLRMLRVPVSTRGNHSAISTVDIIDDRIILEQEFIEDEFFCASAVVVSTSGDKSRTEFCSQSGVRLSLAPGSEDFTVFIASAASFDPEENVVARAIKNCEEAESMGTEDLLRSNKGHSFICTVRTVRLILSKPAIITFYMQWRPAPGGFSLQNSTACSGQPGEMPENGEVSTGGLTKAACTTGCFPQTGWN
jgi:hypothetical protein